MYKLDFDLLDGYLYLLNRRILSIPFKENSFLIAKYARGFRPQGIHMTKLVAAYASEEPILKEFLQQRIENLMKNDIVNKFKKVGNIDLNNINDVNDNFMLKFSVASKEIIIEPEYYSQKCKVIFDYFNINVTTEQIEILDFLFRSNIAERILKAQGFDDTVKKLEDEHKKILANNQIEIQALTQERVELYEDLAKRDEEIKAIKAESEDKKQTLNSELNEAKEKLKRQEARIRQIDLSKAYKEIEDPDLLTSFCIYGIHTAHSTGEQYTVGYRIADIYNDRLVDKQQKRLKFVKIHPSIGSRLAIGESGIWSFTPPDGLGKEYDKYSFQVFEVVTPKVRINDFDNNYEILGEQLGQGIEIVIDEIVTNNFLLVVKEMEDQYIGVITNKEQWKQAGHKSKLIKFDYQYQLVIINRDLIYPQEDAIWINDREYMDRAFIINRSEGISNFKKVDLIYSKEILVNAISKIKNIYDISKGERQKFKRLIEEILSKDDDKYKKLLQSVLIKGEYEEQQRENMLIKGLDSITEQLQDWDEYFMRLIKNHPELYKVFASKVEREWKQKNSIEINKETSELNNLKEELNRTEEELRKKSEEVTKKEKERNLIVSQIESMDDNIYKAVKKASDDALEVVANNIILNAISKNRKSDNGVEAIVTKAKPIADDYILEIDDKLDNIVLDNLDLYNYSDNGNDILIPSLIIASIYSNLTPIIISRNAKTILDCISIAIYGVPCNIVDLPVAMKKPILYDELQALVSDPGLVLLRGALGGINETNIMELLRGELDGKMNNRLVLSCEQKDDLRYVPKWFFNYTTAVDLETCFLNPKKEGQFEQVKDFFGIKCNEGNRKLVDGILSLIKKAFPEITPQLNSRYVVANLINEIEDDALSVAELMMCYDLVPILQAFGISWDEIVDRVSSMKSEIINVEDLLKKLEIVK